MATAAAATIFPSAPKVHSADLPAWRLLPAVMRSSLAIWPDFAFDILVNKRTLLGVTSVLVNDPEGVRHFLAVNAANYRRPSSVRRVAFPLGGSGLFLAEGVEWRRQRKLLAPSFAPTSINVLVPHFHEAARHLLHGVEGKPEVNLSKAFQDTALEAVLRALFSMPENEAREKLSTLVRGYVEGAGRPGLFDGFAPSDDSFGFALGKRRRFQSKWFAAIAAIIAERKAEPKLADRRDLLDLLLELKDAETGDTLSDDEIRDQSATMFFAGSETTARLMFWTAYLLTLDMEEQWQLSGEVTAFPPDRVRALEDLANWPRLRNVLLEALRLYPPLPHIIRQANGPDTICGISVAANDQIWASAWIMHRHRKFWQNPTAFMPDRFAGKSAPWVQMPAFIPFGVGPRICIGLHFALSEAQIVLAHLLARYRITASRKRSVMPVGRLTIEPDHEPAFRLERI
ncbi:MAG: cytochrome P450 [Bradyrhizobium sp.]